MTQFATVKHNQEQAYGAPNGSGGTVTDALSGKISQSHVATLASDAGPTPATNA